MILLRKLFGFDIPVSAPKNSGRHNNPTQQHAKRKGNKLNLKAKAKRKRIRSAKH